MKNNPTHSATKPGSKCVVLLIPTAAWETLKETLAVDTESSAIDPDLRREIAKALAQVRPITEPVTALLDVAEEVPRCAHLTTGAGTAHVLGDERVGKLAAALHFFRSPFKLHGGRRQYRKQLV